MIKKRPQGRKAAPKKNTKSGGAQPVVNTMDKQLKDLEARSAGGTSPHEAALVTAMKDPRVNAALKARMKAGSIHLGISHPTPNRVAFHFAPKPGTMSLVSHSLAVDVDPTTRSVTALRPLDVAPTTQLVSCSLTGGQGGIVTVDGRAIVPGRSTQVPILPPSVNVVYSMDADGPTAWNGSVTINGKTQPEQDTIIKSHDSFIFNYPLSVFGL